jgi:hypothetical protein
MDIFFRLNNQIKQELVDEETQKVIYKEFKQISETSEALHVLKTMINFACITSHNPDLQLSELIKSIYIQNTAVDSILKSKIIESCRLKHLKHIWLIIMMRRAVLFTIASQDPFEMLEEMFRDIISNDIQSSLKIPSNSLALVSIALVFHQLIILFIYPLKSFDDKRIYSSYSVRDTILSIEDIDTGKLQIAFPNNTQPAYLYDLFPENLTLGNILEIWKLIVENLSRQQ